MKPKSIKFSKKKEPDGSFEFFFKNTIPFTRNSCIVSINSRSLRVSIRDNGNSDFEYRSYRQALIIAPDFASIAGALPL